MSPARKPAIVCLLGLLLFLLFVSSAIASPISAKKERLKAVQSQLDAAYARSEIAVERFNQASSRLATVRDQIVRNRRLLALAEQKLATANEHLAARARQVYMAEDVSVIDVVLSSRTFDDLVTQLDLMERLAESDADAVLVAADYRQEVDERRVALAADEKAVEKLVAQRRDSRDAVLAVRSQLEGVAGGLEGDIAELEAEAAARAKAAARAAAAEAARAASAASTGTPADGGGDSASGGDSSSGGDAADSGGSSGGVVPSSGGYPGVVAIAQRYLGVPYVYGGASPSGFDCSGLTMYCYAQVGVQMAHGATLQQQASTPVSLRDARPGDLVFFGNASFSSHVGIYVGGGQMIHAPHTGAVVSYGSAASAWTAGRF